MPSDYHNRTREELLQLLAARAAGERTLRESEAQFRAIFENAAIGVSLADLTGRLVRCNPALQRLLGYPEAQLQGMTFVELTHADDREADLKLYRSLVAGECNHYQLEKRYLRQDGQPVWVRLTVSLVHPTDHHPQYAIGIIEDITERKRAETALRESEEKFAKAFRASTDAVAITDLATGRFIEINESYPRVFGYTREEVLGRTSVELELWENPADRDRLVQQLRQVGLVRDVEANGRNRRGERIHTLISAEIIEIAGRPCVVSVVHDITARVRTEAALRASEESLRATIENTPHVAVQWYDAHGTVVFWNKASERMYGWTATEAAGRSLGELMLTPTEAAAFVATLAPIAQTGAAVGPVEIPFRRRDGSPGVSLSTIFRIPAATGDLRFVCMDVDVTARLAAEESLRAAQARELAAREEFARHLLTAQEEDRRRIATELHDSLGQNLLLIKNYAQLALTQAGDAAALHLQLVRVSSAAVQAIDEVRRIAHDLRPYQLDQLGLTGALEAMIERAAQSTGIAIARKLESVDDVFAPAEAVNVYRIVQESLNNILKHSHAKHARVELERDVRDARLRIEDQGCGFNMDASGTQEQAGFGLKNIAERVRILGGTLKIETLPGQGTRLEVTIPIRDGD
jgi:PAS domain S-box-containing protein